MGHTYAVTNMVLYDMITQSYMYPNFNAGLPKLFLKLEHAFLFLI